MLVGDSEMIAVGREPMCTAPLAAGTVAGKLLPAAGLAGGEANAMRVLFDVGGAPPLAYAERAHAGALSFE
ncbi:MAG TPA: hypothetical protein VLL69_05055, partial [Streptosporangiaceae bacterium]|nr:hypothetical protein [Streptosporangiaceae bacterium]